MYFGKFLIGKCSIDTNKILEATIEQMESIPSLLRVLKEENVLSNDALLDLLTKNIESGRPMLSIIKDENLLDNNAIEALLEKQFSSGKRLSQILIEKNLISYSELERLIEEFSRQADEVEKSDASQEKEVAPLNDAALESLRELGISMGGESENGSSEEKISQETSLEAGPEVSSAAMDSLKELGISLEDSEQPVTSEVAPSNEEETEAKEAPELSSAAMESLKELGISIDEAPHSTVSTPVQVETKESVSAENTDNLDRTFVGHLLELFDEEKFSSISSSVKLLAKGPNEDVLKSIHQELKTILGAAKLSKTQLLPKLLIAWESVIEHILGKNIDFAETNFLSIASSFKVGIGLSWEIRKQIEDKENESGLLKDQSWKEKYMTNLRAAIAFIK